MAPGHPKKGTKGKANMSKGTPSSLSKQVNQPVLPCPQEVEDGSDTSDEESVSSHDEGTARSQQITDEDFVEGFDETVLQVQETTKKGIALLSFVNNVNKTGSLPVYQDISPQIIDGTEFFIDGDSLLMFALTSEGLSMDYGGQTLHIVYLVEKFLMSFSSRNLKFTVIFFEIWDSCWEHFPHFSVARASLKLHLLRNMPKINVLTMWSLWRDDFFHLVEDKKPSFLLVMTQIPNFLNVATKPEENWMQFLRASQLMYCACLHVDVVDIETVLFTPASIMASVYTDRCNSLRIKAIIEGLEKTMPVLKKRSEKIYELPTPSIRSSIFILAAAAILKKDSCKDTVNIVKTVLLSAAFLECIPLKMRCFKYLSRLSQQVTTILIQFQNEMSYILRQVCPDSPLIDFTLAGDLWQGKFIQAVFDCVSQVGVVRCKEDVGNRIASDYEEFLAQVNKQVCADVVPYPIENIGDSPCAKPDEGKVIQTTDEDCTKLIPTTCQLTDMFTGSLASNELYYSLFSRKGLNELAVLHETRHWHNKKPMTDAIERIPDNAANNAPNSNPRYSQYQRNAFARFNTLYGLSLEGRSSVTAIVATKTSSSNEGQKKQVHQPSKSQSKGKLNKKEKIVEANNKRIQEEKLRQIKDRRDNFFSKEFSRLMLKGNFCGAVDRCNEELSSSNEFPELVFDILFFKGKACFEMWKTECYTTQSKRNLDSAKKLFLVIRDIFQLVEAQKKPLNLKQMNQLASWILALGFKALCEIKGLPDPGVKSSGNLKVGMNHVEFQLIHLRADLVRDSGGMYDPRADGFMPDPWQVELFDIIDKKESAVVIAPTSSGKTYASYYCMETVIRESDDGVVVYVSPTKALVNQVYATIYSRFKKKLPPGKALLGTLTRDYRENAMNCQILITVPECFEILLMSPRSQTWVRRIKYVIYDEVHCLVAQAGGVTWENCILLNRSPFLALSATISKPELFCQWLQKVEDYKQTLARELVLEDRSFNSYKVSLILHQERHNHLIKSVMNDDGSLSHVHPYSFLSRATKNIPEHISLSPNEALELYLAMKQELKSEQISNFCLLKYFQELCPSGFLSMQSVQMFRETLRNILCEENLEDRGKVLNKLPTADFDSVNTSKQHLMKNIPVAMNSLKERNLMPALVFSYNRVLVEILPVILVECLRRVDSFDENEDTDGTEVESDLEEKKKGSNKEYRRYRTHRYKKKLGIMRGPSVLKSSGSLRGGGVYDKKLIDFIEQRLIKVGHKALDELPSMLRRGLGKHHGGLNARERSAVEMLFRSKILNLVFATGTLALGIHMPCKTVVVAGDSPYLNALEFHQMSGRAGRRGFDKEGNVIFYGLHKRKIEALMTTKMPSMVGNFPLSCSRILRLLLLVSDTTIDGKVSKEATAESCARAITLLENGLLYESQEDLKSKMKYYFSFVVQFLMQQNLLRCDGKLNVDATFITHVHYHEPANFAFYFLLNSGVLGEICNEITETSLQTLVIILNFLFGRIPVTQKQIDTKKSNSVILLPPLPKQVIKVLKTYNKEVMNIFCHYFKCVASDVNEKFGDEKNLPLSGINVQSDNVFPTDTLEDGKVLPFLGSLCSHSNVCSAFAGLSGNTDEDVSSTMGDIHHIRGDVNVKVIPTIELNFKCNAYAFDFYKHGIAVAIRRENGLRAGNDFDKLKDFLLVTKAIYVSLSEMLEPDTNIVKAFEKIVSTFQKNFQKAFYAYKD